MFVYLSSPYTHDEIAIEEFRYERAMDAVVWLLNRKITVYSPIVHFHPIAWTHNLSRDIQFWRNHNLNMLLSAREVIVLAIPGWKESIGVSWEREEATNNNKPLSYLEAEAGNPAGFRLVTEAQLF
jgi:hypothetical protein